MVEPADAKELIDDAIERAEAREDARESTQRSLERDFRNRVSLLVGIFAAALAFVHVVGASNARAGLFDTIEASDTYAYMEAKIIRETVLTSAAAGASIPGDQRAKLLIDAARLRHPDRAGHGIDQLRRKADALRERGKKGAELGERFELSETGLQIAIVLLSIALIAQSWRVVLGASLIATGAIVAALVTWWAT